MVDAAEVLRDAGEMVGDAMGADAAAQDPPRDVPCDIERTRTVETATTRTTQTWWLAEVVDPSIDPDAVRDVETLICDREYFGPLPWADAECPAGSTCTGVGSVAPPAFRCTIGSGAEIEAGRIRVHCGNLYRVDNLTTGVSAESGSRGASVRITVVR